MAIENRNNPLKPEMLENSVEPLEDEEIQEFVENEDGSVDFVIAEEEANEPVAFSDNLVSILTPDEYLVIANDVIEQTNQELESRRDWEDNITKGLEQLGLKIDETSDPFPGACTATVPLLIENAVKFQAKASGELFPPGGPVKTQIMGEVDEAQEMKALRVQKFMNYQCTEQMPEFFDEKERLFFYSCLVGSGFTKTYWEGSEDRPCVDFVRVQDFSVDFSAKDLRRACYTHILYKDENDYQIDVENDLYINEDIGTPEQRQLSDFDRKLSEIQGLSVDEMEAAKVYTFYERYMYLRLSEDDLNKTKRAVPYIVTVDKESARILGIRRNWKEGDRRYKPLQYFTHYKYVPGFGFFGYGLIALIGNLTKTATAALRALIDSGQFATLQGGFKTKGMRLLNNDPLQPGEWKDVESTSGDLSKSMLPIPYKEPSATLMTLLEFVTNGAQNFANMTDSVVSDSTNYGPVGTTLALLENSAKFFSGVYKRFHKSQRDEFRILARINSEYLPDEYPYTLPEEQQRVLRSDFDGSIDVVPVSDPNISSQAHRMALVNAQLQLAQQAPQLYDTRALHKSLLHMMGILDTNKIMPPPEDVQPADPLTDIMNTIKNKPIGAFPGQDHEAHIAVKSAWLQDPMQGANPLMAQAAPLIMSNVREHMILQYQEQIQGISETASGQVSPAEMDEKVMGKIISHAAEQVLKANQSKAAGPTDIEQANLMLQARDLELKAFKIKGEQQAKVAELAQKTRELDIKQNTMAIEALQKGIDQDIDVDKSVLAAHVKLEDSATKRFIAKQKPKTKPVAKK